MATGIRKTGTFDGLSGQGWEEVSVQRGLGGFGLFGKGPGSDLKDFPEESRGGLMAS